MSLIDGKLVIATDFSIAGTAFLKATDAVPMAACDFGAGQPMCVQFKCKEAVTRHAGALGCYVEFMIIAADDAALTTNMIEVGNSAHLGSTFNLSGALPAVNDEIIVPIRPIIGANNLVFGRKHVGAAFYNVLKSIEGTAPAFANDYFDTGKFDIRIVPLSAVNTGGRIYPSGIPV